MPRHVRLLVSVAATAALAGSALAVTGAPGSAAPADAASAAVSRLKSDASGRLTLRSDASGRVTFVGVPAGSELTTPGVTRATSVADAAGAALQRYGAALGITQAGTSLSPLSSSATSTGDVARYQQEVGGLPVLGGEVVVSLGQDRQPTSILGETSWATSVKAARVSGDAARATAVQAFEKVAGAGAAPSVTDQGRWVLDPTLVELSPSLGTRTVHRFELTRGADERRMVLVDDQTGGVLLDADMIANALNRVVCDNANSTANDPDAEDPKPCVTSSPPARVEGQAPVGQADVDTAYDLAGAVSQTYAGLGVDLTALIGRDIGGGTKALAQTVRMCFTDPDPSVPGNPYCPYGNAFWNGQQMYYGTGFAGADDVVGHEMTHGVTERSSNLVYWGQSGAMNESISDIMGEIVDHQHVTASDTPATAWAIGEDVPGFPEGLRDMQDPTKYGNADKTSSPLWVREDIYTDGTGYPDQDGVHSNSGVGNKTFYLISQGGTFNGQTISGIDAGDPNLTRSAKLWLLTDQSLSSGSDYADEAAVLEQSCATLQAAGQMTAANCEAVHQATLATELRQTPLNAAQPADAQATCPTGSVARTLFDSESGDPASKFVAGATWDRAGVDGFGPVAKSGTSSWSSEEPATAGRSSLVAANGISLPAGRTSYLYFQHWRLLDYDYGGVAYDAGTVEVDDVATPDGPVDAAGLPWVNGPEQTILSSTNPANKRKGFGGDSRGYTASRLDLSSFAGKTVKPQFTMNTDASVSFIGWYVDDITVYTCDPKVVVGKVKAKGKAVVGKKLKAKVTGLPSGATISGYQWLRDGKAIQGADGKKYKLKRKDKGDKISVIVTATAPTYAPGTQESGTRKVHGKPKRHHR
ncbi:hypothetical protein G5V58_12485 [Nocardioides anomalus]|uniref:M4 family metallopeptidase n=1 Tax=Nocardioides anomalus TaxID=2712223 RepID=A0A6G6WE06_9ACTN|nr:M4 family metallopeptidase [Nocardioides anomalus]QIG43472.1 hypothetical protein G5V58_12485 [Nocardioides anomalus]